MKFLLIDGTENSKQSKNNGRESCSLLQPLDATNNYVNKLYKFWTFKARKSITCSAGNFESCMEIIKRSKKKWF